VNEQLISDNSKNRHSLTAIVEFAILFSIEANGVLAASLPIFSWVLVPESRFGAD
jgi:hypothetical protein